MLSSEERATLAALCETLLPSLEPGQGDDASLYPASAASRGVAMRVEETLSVLGEGERSRFRLFLRLLNQPLFIALQSGRFVRFASLPVAEAERVLKSLATSRLPDLRSGFQAIRRLATFHYFSAAEGMSPDPVWRAIGYEPSRNPPAAPRPVRLTRITSDTRIDCDACVIGSGAGGSVAAAQLAAAGLRVVVLEAGSDWQSEDFDQREGPGTLELYLDRGTTATRDLSLGILAGAAVGGGTAVNWQTSLRTPDGVRAEWAEKSGCSHFAEESFTRSLDSVWERLSVGTAESIVNPNNAALRDGCTALGYDWATTARNSIGCDTSQCGYCVYGCRHGGKQSGGVTWLHDAQASGNTTVTARCRAERVTIAGGRVRGVEATATDSAGRRYAVTVDARIVVAACGSLHTPALLFRSGVGLPQLGRNLHLHPTTAVGAVFENRIAAWEGPPQTIVCNEFAGLENGYGFRIETAPAHPGLLALAVPWVGGRAHRDQMARAAQKAMLIVLVRDRSTGTVTVDRAGRPVVEYRPGDSEKSLLREGMARTARILHAAGASGVQTLHTIPISMGEAARDGRRMTDIDSMCAEIARSKVGENHLALFSAHQMGTCRMGRDATSAVCDERGEVFGVRGLFVADASAFPGSSGVNPMITIMALAHHISTRIAEE